MSNPVYAQEKSPESTQLLSETETSEDLEDEEFDDGFEDEFESAEKEIFDPLSGYNTVMTEFNDGFYIYVLDPVARGYEWVMPDLAQSGVKNFFHNLLFPIRFVNNALQLKPINAGEELFRFIINSLWEFLVYGILQKNGLVLKRTKRILDKPLDIMA